MVDPYTTLLTIWAGLQLTWVTLLALVQVHQVTRAVTTYESANLQRYGFMGGSNEERFQEGSQPTGTAPNTPFQSPEKTSITKRMLKLCSRTLGIEIFYQSAKDSLFRRRERQRQRRNLNPFDQGSLFRNCSDFWWMDPEAGINDQQSTGHRMLQLGWGIGRFGSSLKPGASGKVGGQIVDYYHLFEVPRAVAPMQTAARTVNGTDYEGVEQEEV